MGSAEALPISAEALPILCVRCARCVCVRERERERERDTETDGSDVSLVHRDLSPVQIDLAVACTDSGKLSRKCEYPP